MAVRACCAGAGRALKRRTWRANTENGSIKSFKSSTAGYVSVWIGRLSSSYRSNCEARTSNGCAAKSLSKQCGAYLQQVCADGFGLFERRLHHAQDVAVLVQEAGAGAVVVVQHVVLQQRQAHGRGGQGRAHLVRDVPVKGKRPAFEVKCGQKRRREARSFEGAGEERDDSTSRTPVCCSIAPTRAGFRSCAPAFRPAGRTPRRRCRCKRRS